MQTVNQTDREMLVAGKDLSYRCQELTARVLPIFRSQIFSVIRITQRHGERFRISAPLREMSSMAGASLAGSFFLSGRRSC